MRYLEAADDAAWIKLCQLLSASEPLDLVLCLYPGTSPADTPSPFEPATGGELLERVTVYDDDLLPPCSSRARITTALLEALSDRSRDFEDLGDNLALYRPGECEWIAAYIPHERMLLLADDTLSDAAAGRGLRFVQDAPEWW